jgi:hypothetical protein
MPRESWIPMLRSVLEVPWDANADIIEKAKQALIALHLMKPQSNVKVAL